MAGVRGYQRVGQGAGNAQQFVNVKTTRRDASVEAVAIDQIHGEETVAFVLFDRVDRDDRGVVEGGNGLGLSLEARQALRI
ncbi:MAG: hypothetical protein OSB03_16470 [Vicinamibacterales bacterium]|nr:hypothetical protein [Vicinamibacterales bacterium]